MDDDFGALAARVEARFPDIGAAIDRVAARYPAPSARRRRWRLVSGYGCLSLGAGLALWVGEYMPHHPRDLLISALPLSPLIPFAVWLRGWRGGLFVYGVLIAALGYRIAAPPTELSDWVWLFWVMAVFSALLLGSILTWSGTDPPSLRRRLRRLRLSASAGISFAGAICCAGWREMWRGLRRRARDADSDSDLPRIA